MYQIGIDIGGTGIKAGLVEEGKIIASKSIPTRVDDGVDIIVDDIVQLINYLREEAGSNIITGVGIGCPGTITSSAGVVDFSANLNWKFVPLADKVNAKVSLPVRVSNDANVAALGEAKYGAGKKFNSSIMVTLGTGVGGGIIIDGKLFEGNQSKGAEIGHSVIKSGGEKCSCGRRGCFEAYSSATALIRDTKRAMQKNPGSLLWKVCPKIDDVNGKTVFDARLLGDKAAIAVYDEYIRMLGESLVNLVNTFRPEAIILGGGICAEGDVLLLPLKKYIAEHSFGSGPHVGLYVASLKNNAGIIGAAALVEWVNK